MTDDERRTRREKTREVAQLSPPDPRPPDPPWCEVCNKPKVAVKLSSRACRCPKPKKPEHDETHQMMLSNREGSELDNVFTNHSPNEETTPKYQVIRAAEKAVHELISCIDAVNERDINHADIDEITKAFAQTVFDTCPPCADRSAAIRCVRLARCALNEVLALRASTPAAALDIDDPEQHTDELWVIAYTELVKARWQANSAIALGGAV